MMDGCWEYMVYSPWGDAFICKHGCIKKNLDDKVCIYCDYSDIDLHLSKCVDCGALTWHLVDICLKCNSHKTIISIEDWKDLPEDEKARRIDNLKLHLLDIPGDTRIDMSFVIELVKMYRIRISEALDVIGGRLQ